MKRKTASGLAEKPKRNEKNDLEKCERAREKKSNVSLGRLATVWDENAIFRSKRSAM